MNFKSSNTIMSPLKTYCVYDILMTATVYYYNIDGYVFSDTFQIFLIMPHQSNCGEIDK